MKIDRRFEDLGYFSLFIVFIVGFYIIQHECVRYGVDAIIDGWDRAALWFASFKSAA